MGIKMQHVNLVMGKHCIEEGRERGIRLAHKVSTKNRTSVTVLSMEAWNTGQAIISPHSLKLEESAWQTLPRASRLSTNDRPTAGLIAGDELDKGRGFFPFSLLVGAMAMERAVIKSDWKRKQRFEEESGTGSTRAARRK